jgi:tetratricopeptide (TPR) repeat protein
MDVDNRSNADAEAVVEVAGKRPVPAANFSRAQELHSGGRFDAAAHEYQGVLAREPRNAEALHLYGVLQYQRGAREDAERLIRESLALEPAAVSPLCDLGAILADSGRASEGVEQFEAALRIDPDNVQVLVRLGNTRLGQRQPEAALAAFDRVLQLSPLVIDALCNRGSALRALGRHKDALETYDRALMVDPRSFESWFNRALVLREMKRDAEALHCLDQAIGIQPGIAAMYSLQGQTLVELGRLNEALAAFNEAIAIEPGMVEALFNSAVALERLNRAAEALNRCERVLALVPGHTLALACRGNALQQMKRYDEALASYDLALQAQPGAVDVLCNRGTVLRFLKRYDDALACYDKAIAGDGQLAQAWTNRASVLQDLHRYDEAVVASNKALELRPEDATNWLNHGNLHYETGQEADALHAYGRAVAIAPDYAEAHCSLAVLNLLRGDFEPGWREYEWRFKDPTFKSSFRQFVQPQWSGRESLDGKTILLHAEQGFGDTLQFSRYASVLAARGVRVVLAVQWPLHSLLTTLSGPAQLLGKGDPLPAFDFHCPLLSMPFAFDTTVETIPSQTPYLHADPQRVRDWEALLGEKRRPRIGLAWAGNPEHRHDHKRSIELAALSSLFSLDVEWISLQKQIPERDEQQLSATPIRRFDDELLDFADTAALIKTLDLVISVDSAVAHLAGAIGHPVWILLADPPEWRWMRTRDDSPWYPGAKLFRQTVPGQWSHVVDALAREISAIRR